MPTPEEMKSKAFANHQKAGPRPPSLEQSFDRSQAIARGDALPPDWYQDQALRKHFESLARYLSDAFRGMTIVATEPAHAVPAFWSQPLDVFGSAEFAGSSLVDWTTIAEFTTQTGRWARVAQYGLDVDDDGGTYDYSSGVLEFRFLLGANPVPSLSNFTEHRGSTLQPRDTYFTSSGENDTAHIQFQGRKVDAGNQNVQTVTANFRGWTWRPDNNYEGPKVSQAS